VLPRNHLARNKFHLARNTVQKIKTCIIRNPYLRDFICNLERIYFILLTNFSISMDVSIWTICFHVILFFYYFPIFPKLIDINDIGICFIWRKKWPIKLKLRVLYVKHIWLMKLPTLHLIILVMTCKQYRIEFQEMMTVALNVLMDNF